MIRNSEPREGMQTPWGKADNVSMIAPGIWNVGTPSHGGIKVDRSHNAKIPDYMRQPGGWYEEDCDWCIPFVVFEKEILTAGNVRACDDIVKRKHEHTLENWHPDEFEKFFGITASETSYIKSKRNFEKENADKWVVKAAWGDHQSGVPKGMVGVVASIGGKRASYGETIPEKWFLVPEEEYQKRTNSFVIDPSRHAEVAKFIPY